MATPLPESTLDPLSFYEDHFQQRQQSTRQLYKRHLLMGNVRLLWAAMALLILWFDYTQHRITWAWLFLPLAGFLVTSRVHNKILGDYARSWRGQLYYEKGLARVQDRWAGLQPRPTPLSASQSLYAADLDIFGPNSLFELLCTCRSTLGEDVLAAWLSRAATAEQIHARHACIDDLRARVTLREAVAAIPGAELLEIDQEPVAAWGEQSGSTLPSVFTWLGPLLVVLTLAAAAASILMRSTLPLVPFLVVNAAITYRLQAPHKHLFAVLQQRSRQLALLTEIATILEQQLEQQSFTAGPLLELQARLGEGQTSAWRALRQLALLAGACEQRSNYLVRLLEFGSLYSVHLGLLVQRWQRRYGPSLRSWMETLGEFEALLALAGYSFEHPLDPFPQLVDEAPPIFAAEELGHPLLAANSCVRNSVTLDSATHLLLVSGSNMSGKSTLLRSVGINAVLAFAGAPVRAKTLLLSPLTVAASIQIHDSLQQGRSRFYAEILRLRSITEAARTHPPVLFLLDELLAGTNSSDRLEGARGLIRELLRAGAIGLMSTHDLALSSLDVEGRAQLRNVHFEDEVVDDQLRFDYTLREGTVQRSNGLALMRMIGLDV